MIQNAPKRIYLQIEADGEDLSGVDFKELCGISWCGEQIHKSDLEYISAEEHMQTVTSYLGQTVKATEEIEKLKAEIKKLSGNIATMLVRSSELRAGNDKLRHHNTEIKKLLSSIVEEGDNLKYLIDLSGSHESMVDFVHDMVNHAEGLLREGERND